jgi:hypothetical protein
MRIEKRRIQYFVVPSGEHWLVRRDGKFYGPYKDRETAIARAIETAQISGRNDRAAEVLTQGEDGEFHPEWTYGEDMYPPQGERPLSPW